MHLSLKMVSGMANNEDPDQTAPLALFAYATLSETLAFKILGYLSEYRLMCPKTAKMPV